MGVFQATDGAVAGDPGGKLLEMHLPASRDMDALQVLLKREEIDLLILIGIAGGVVEIPRVVHQVGRAGDIEDIPHGLLHLLQGQHGLAASRRADDDQWRLEGVDSALGLVKREHLIQYVEGGVIGVEVNQRLLLHLIDRPRAGDFGLIHHAAAIEKAGFFVGMLFDVLQNQGISLSPVAVNRKQQPVAAVQARAIEILPHLLDLGRAEIIRLQVGLHLLESGDFGGIDLVIE